MMRKNTLKNKIDLQLYKKIVDLMPICCVDIIFKAGKKVYLFKRDYEPAKNKWWVIGGRVLKGEKLKDAVIRKVKEEVGVDVKITKTVGAYEIFFDTSRFSNKDKKIRSHSIVNCYVVEPKNKNFVLKLNEEYTGYKAIIKINKDLDPYIKGILRDSGAL